MFECDLADITGLRDTYKDVLHVLQASPVTAKIKELITLKKAIEKAEKKLTAFQDLCNKNPGWNIKVRRLTLFTVKDPLNHFQGHFFLRNDTKPLQQAERGGSACHIRRPFGCGSHWW